MEEGKEAIQKRISVEGGFFYWDVLYERTYGKISGSFVWPGLRPGYALIIAADKFEDPKYDGRHLWTLAEREEVDLVDLFKWMVRASGHWQVEHWLGDLSSFAMSELLDRFNREQREKRAPELRCETPPYLNDGQRFTAAMTSTRTYTAPSNKLLHLGPCELLKAQLRAFPPDAIDKAKDWPALLALSYVLESVKQAVSPPADTRQKYAICDYDPFGHDRYR